MSAVANTWTSALAEAFETMFSDLEETLTTCPDDLWEASMWDVTKDTGWGRPDPPVLATGEPDPRGVNVYSSFWQVTLHLLYVLDWNMSEHAPDWKPPEPIQRETPRVVRMTPYTRDELLAYAKFCRQKVQRMLGSMADDDADRQTEAKVGWRPTTLARRLLNNLAHATDHQATLAMFVWQNRQ